MIILPIATLIQECNGDLIEANILRREKIKNVSIDVIFTMLHNALKENNTINIKSILENNMFSNNYIIQIYLNCIKSTQL